MAEVLKMVRAVIDSRTTMVCLDAAGQRRRIGEPFSTLLGPQMAPPFHVWCRSIIVPYLPGMDTQRVEAEREARKRTPSQRRSRPPLATETTNRPNNLIYTTETPRELPPGWARPFTKDERVNTRLRSGKPLADAPAPVRDAVADMDRAIAQAPPLEKPLRGYRTLTGPAALAGRSNATGLVFSDPGFASMTTRIAVAAILIQALADNPADGVVLIITAPTGTRVVELDDVPANAEAVLARGTRYRVDSDKVEKFQGRMVRVWRVTVLPPGGASHG